MTSQGQSAGAVDGCRGGALPRPTMTIPPSWPKAMTPQLRFAAQPSVHPKGTCFAASTGPPYRGRRGVFRACGRGGAMRASPPTDEQRGCGRTTSLSGASRCLPHRGRRGAFRACGRGGAMWASPPTKPQGVRRITMGGQSRPSETLDNVGRMGIIKTRGRCDKRSTL